MSLEHPQPEHPARIFGVVAVHDECAVGECHEPASAAAPMQLPMDTGVWWLCENHADVMPWFEGVNGRLEPPRVFNLAPTCCVHSLGGEYPSCGAAADYLVITQNHEDDGTGFLGVVSVCERHAKQALIF
jgi:hypothetical protein